LGITPEILMHIDIFLILLLIVFGLNIYSHGPRDGIIITIIYAIIGTISGLIIDVKIFGDMGRYALGFFLFGYGLFLYFRCGKELSNSFEGQGICIKRAFSQLLKKIKSRIEK
jgi:hypothetical protein